MYRRIFICSGIGNECYFLNFFLIFFVIGIYLEGYKVYGILDNSINGMFLGGGKVLFYEKL